MPDRLSPDDRSRFAVEFGVSLPSGLRAPARPPALQLDVDALIALNRYVREPGTPWIGERGDPWPHEHVVIGEDLTGNYWSMLHRDHEPPDAGVWFLDHEVGTLTPMFDTIGRFRRHLSQVAASIAASTPEWQVVAIQSVGSITFGMARARVRSMLGEPFTEVAGRLAPDPTGDLFTDRRITVGYCDGLVEVVSFADPSQVWVAGHRIGAEDFLTMATILTDYAWGDRQVISETSILDPARGVEIFAAIENGVPTGQIASLDVFSRSGFERRSARKVYP
jgi:hypothetical protein